MALLKDRSGFIIRTDINPDIDVKTKALTY
ncbi:hypothetical protein M2273_005187 [Mucilaginibacter lappiensis]|jgi:hypothetical protein